MHTCALVGTLTKLAEDLPACMTGSLIKGQVPGKLTGCEDDFASLVRLSGGTFFLYSEQAQLKMFAHM